MHVLFIHKHLHTDFQVIQVKHNKILVKRCSKASSTLKCPDWCLLPECDVVRVGSGVCVFVLHSAGTCRPFTQLFHLLSTRPISRHRQRRPRASSSQHSNPVARQRDFRAKKWTDRDTEIL